MTAPVLVIAGTTQVLRPPVRSSYASSVLDRSITAGLLSVLVLTALAHGAVEPWSVALFELILIGTLLMWSIKSTVDRQIAMTIPAAAFPIAALLLLGVAQSVARLSVDVEATNHVVTVLFFLLISFIAAANFLVTRERLVLLANVLTVFGAVLATFALIQHVAWDNRLYWFRATDRSVFGPFVNHNHFAGYMAMLIPVPVALILTVVRGHARLVYGFAAVVMGTAAIVSGSRSGVISLIAAAAFMAILNKRSRRLVGSSFSKVGPITVVTMATIAGVLWIGATRIIERFGEAMDALLRSGSPDLGRAEIWRDTLEIIRDYPILGAGLGSYETIYPRYANSQNLFGLDYAHNDYLQVLADAGIAGGVLAVWFLVAVFRSMRRGVHSRDPLHLGMTLAASAGIFAVLLQSLSDTNLQIPSNSMLFLVLCAVNFGDVDRIHAPHEFGQRHRGSEQ